MEARGLRLHHRIIIPFAVVALIATASIAYVALLVTERTLRSHAEAQVQNTVAAVAQSDFALNPTILRSAKAIAHTDIVTYSTDGRVLASTLPPEESARIVASILAGREMECGEPCHVAQAPLRARPDVRVAAVSRTTDLRGATDTITRTIIIAALLSLIVMIVVSQAVARRITAPLDALVTFTREVSGGSGRRAPDGADEVGRLGGAFNDMLDRVEHSQQALVRSEKLALAGLFAARVAHDVRNPLSSIKMQTQLLKARLRGGSDPQNQVILEAVQRDILQVESVVRDLLELARPGDLKLQNVQLGELLDEVLGGVMPRLTHRKIRVERVPDGRVPPLRLDPDRFGQALLNIINNAADAMPSGGTLAIATRLTADGSTVLLDVCDDGMGIPQTMLEKVFDPFVSTKPGGVGLGLVNAKAVVESHGGCIELAPRAPAGTRATIQLPVQPLHG